MTNKLSFVIIHKQINATMAQMVEHILGKDEVTSSILVSSSKIPHNSVGFLLIYYYATRG